MIAFRIAVPAAHEDTATAVLWDLGTEGIEVQTGPAGAVSLLSYFPEDAGVLERLREALAGLPSARVEPAEVPEVDWVARFREGFRPFRVGPFVVAPLWDVPADADPRTRIIVDPGRAFGTGTHETTRLCLLALEEVASRRPLGRTLDVGAGTGILAVAAALLGARSVAAVDIDAEAIESARAHARLNGVDLRVVRGDGGRPFAAGVFDLVLANMTAPLLRDRSSEIAALCSPYGSLVLSGLLREQVRGVREAYAGWGSVGVRAEGEWAALLLHRRGV